MSTESGRSIRREKTALTRTALSRPIRTAMEQGVLSVEDEVFDYGCGRGGDVERLNDQGIKASGWDPAFRPDADRRPAAVVNLGYVVNVIENPDERAQTLRSAWDLAKRVLVISARLSGDAKNLTPEGTFEDGCLTSTGTFQKFYDQGELRAWIDASLGVQSVAAAPGVFYAFRDEALEQSFLASRQRQRTSTPRPRVSDLLFEEHQEILEPLMSFFADRGRLPAPNELAETDALVDVFGSTKKAFSVVRRVTGRERWDEITTTRRDDLLVYLALTRFSKRPRFSGLPRDLQLDVKAFAGAYTNACAVADDLLYSAGDMDGIKQACRSTPVGKKLPMALYVHVSALPYLPAVLRVYEGCARSYVGAVDGANLVKLHRDAPKISYLSYPEFEDDPHPVLAGSLVVPLQTHRLAYKDYSKSTNPPVLHRKECFLHEDHPRRQEFASLTEAEVGAGLYADASRIGTRNGWEAALAKGGYRILGHGLVVSSESEDDPQSEGISAAAPGPERRME